MVINLYTQGGRGYPRDITNMEEAARFHLLGYQIVSLRKVALGLGYFITRCAVLHFLGHRTTELASSEDL